MNPKTMMEKVIHNTYSNTAGMIVKKNGETVYENYYNGYTEENKIHVASVTKSFISALIGIAIQQGYIKGIDQKILDYFPNYSVTRGEKLIQQVTLEDMLTMTVPYKCKTEPYAKVFTGNQWVNTALDLLGGKGKIGEFRYSPMVGVQILSGILVQATGKSILDYAKENLFSPLEIHVDHNIILHSKEENLAFLKDRNVNGWVVDTEGINTAGWGLTLNPVDMAKFGQLYLNKGKWMGEQIVPSAWVEDSTSEHSRCNQWKLSYGYLWWVIDTKEHTYAAIGDGGNIIYINDKKGLVIAIACSYMPQAKDRLQLIKKYIEPAFI